METTEQRGFRPATAAVYSGFPRSAIYEAIRSGQLKSYKIDGRRLLLKEDLDDWLNRMITASTPRSSLVARPPRGSRTRPDRLSQDRSSMSAPPSPSQRPCTTDAGPWPLGQPCPDCGHTGMAHPGAHNPAVHTCLVCELSTLISGHTPA